MIATLKNLPWQRLIKFVITGGSALLLDLGVYYLLTRYANLPYLLSRTISLGLAFGWNFSLNRYWTFQAQGGRVSQQAIRFVIVMTATSLLSLALMRLGVSVLRLNDILVLLTVSVLITAINFTAHQFWSYRNG